MNTRGLVVKTGEGGAGSGSREAGDNSSMGRLACLCTAVASLLLMLVALVLQLVEGNWFPLLANAAALVLQVRMIEILVCTTPNGNVRTVWYSY